MRMEANYFNMLVAAYEPLVEPWKVNVDVLQEEEVAPLRAMINFPDMINVNLTFGMAMVVNQFKLRMAEGNK